MTDLNQLNILDITPDSIANDPQIIAMASSLQQKLNDVTAEIPFIEIYSRIDELPEPILRMLAVENRVFRNEWSLATTIEAKRDLVKSSFELNQRRGTRFSVERILGLLNINATLLEWFEYGGDPYRFRVSIFDINGEELTTEQLQQAQRLINQYKPLRASLESVDIVLRSDDVTAYAGAANTMVAVLDCLTSKADLLTIDFNVKSGVLSVTESTSDTYPATEVV